MTDPSPATVADRLVANNAAYAAEFSEAGMHKNPSEHIAIVVCMDARLDPYRMLGLENGQAHLMRNAGGVISDDIVRSLVLSQRALGTREIVLIHHTKCGVQGLDAEAFCDGLEAETGVRPDWPLHEFADPFDDVRAGIERLTNDPFLVHTDQIRGFVYDVDTGALLPVG